MTALITKALKTATLFMIASQVAACSNSALTNKSNLAMSSYSTTQLQGSVVTQPGIESF